MLVLSTIGKIESIEDFEKAERLSLLVNLICAEVSLKLTEEKPLSFHKFRKDIVFISLFLISLPAVCWTQEKSCSLTRKDAPSLREIRLGMTPLEISRKWAIRVNPKVDPQPFFVYTEEFLEKYRSDTKHFRINKKLLDERNPVSRRLLKEKAINKLEYKYIDVVLPEIRQFSFFTLELDMFNSRALEGIITVDLKFLNNQLYKAYIHYETNVYASSTSEEIVSSLAKSLNIPREHWWVSEDKNRGGSVECSKFRVNALFNDDGGSIEMETLDARRVIYDKVTNAVEKMYQTLEKKIKENSDFKP